MENGPAWNLGPDDSNLVTVRSEDGRATPLWLDARLATLPSSPANEGDSDPGFLLEELSVSRLWFDREEGIAGTTPFVSSIDRGDITLVDTGEKLHLDSGAPLDMDRFEGQVVLLALERDGFHVTFTGRTSRLLLGPVGFEQDVTPSVLDVLYHIRWVRLACLAIFAILAAVVAEHFARPRSEETKSEEKR